MGTVVAEMSMSLDGFVADASDGIDEVLRPDSSVTIVIDGLESAVEQAKAAAGETMVGASPTSRTRRSSSRIQRSWWAAG